MHRGIAAPRTTAPPVLFTGERAIMMVGVRWGGVGWGGVGWGGVVVLLVNEVMYEEL